MTNIIHTRLVKLGNSQGIRIPKIILEQLRIVDNIELEVQGNQLILRASRTARDGWATAFQHMAANGDDQLLDDELLPTIWDETEWEWS